MSKSDGRDNFDVGVLTVLVLCFGIGSCVRERDATERLDKIVHEMEVQREVQNRPTNK
jgi:hypothetical protein